MEEKEKPDEVKNLLPGSILISAAILGGAWLYRTEPKTADEEQTKVSENAERTAVSELEGAVLPSEGITLPVTWGDLGSRLASVGAIDGEQFRALYEERGQFTDEYKELLLGNSAGKLRMTRENAGHLLNLFWALGLASKNPVLDSGEMTNPIYGGPENFASTAGWTIAKGNPMEHYSRHKFFILTTEQQALVGKVSKGIFRPCCDNSTHFPDCNHGNARTAGTYGFARGQRNGDVENRPCRQFVLVSGHLSHDCRVHEEKQGC